MSDDAPTDAPAPADPDDSLDADLLAEYERSSSLGDEALARGDLDPEKVEAAIRRHRERHPYHDAPAPADPDAARRAAIEFDTRRRRVEAERFRWNNMAVAAGSIAAMVASPLPDLTLALAAEVERLRDENDRLTAYATLLQIQATMQADFLAWTTAEAVAHVRRQIRDDHQQANWSVADRYTFRDCLKAVRRPPAAEGDHK